ncbi:MAG: phasin family protein [Betaproteobacteria bacterium]|nr:phasin family protein [Betaproteobacteria bacterium]
MYTVPEKVAALNKGNVEAAITVANIVLDSAERLLQVQLSAAKSAVADNAKAAKVLAQVKDVQGLAALQSALPEAGVEKVLGYSRSVYEIAAQTQTELAGLVEERVAEFNKGVIAALEQAAKSAPAGVGADAAVAAVKSAVAAASSAYDTLNKAAKQVADLTEANVTALATKTVAKKKAA